METPLAAQVSALVIAMVVTATAKAGATVTVAATAAAVATVAEVIDGSLFCDERESPSSNPLPRGERT